MAAVAAAVLPLLLLPDGPATLRVPLTPVHYPAGWQQVADRVAGSRATVLVLPFASYRSFDWAPGRTVLDPAPRLLQPPVLVDDRLAVGGTVLAGEDPAAARMREVLAGNPAPDRLAQQLAGLGVGWVVVEAGTPGPPAPDLSGLRPALIGPDVRLYRVPGPIRSPHRSAGQGGAGDRRGSAACPAGAGGGRDGVAKAGRAGLGLLHSPVTFPEQSRRAG